MTTLNYLAQKKSPCLDFLTIVDETAKAIKVESYNFELATGKTAQIWIPKTAIETWSEKVLNEVREYSTVKLWFRNLLKKEGKTIDLKVLGLLAK